MQYTQAQIDRANAVNLEDFLRSQGETLIKSGRELKRQSGKIMQGWLLLTPYRHFWGLMWI